MVPPLSPRSARTLAVAGLAAGLALAAAGFHRLAVAIRDPVGMTPPEGFESLRAASDYETSRACGPCHAEHLKSWRRTFHRTMTQEATPAAIRAPFDGRPVDALGVRSVPWRRGDAFFLDTLDPRTHAVSSNRILRVTGSRRMQQFETKEDDRYVRLPLAWSIEEGRWLHLSEAFFHPDGESFDEPRAVWDLNCIFCHTVKARPGLDSNQRLASRSAELGIACEACHGPGEEHARRMRSPFRRYVFHALHASHATEGSLASGGGSSSAKDASRAADASGVRGLEDPTIVNPARLDKVRSVQICGHCHGQRMPVDRDSIREILASGDPYTAGEDLSKHYTPVVRETMLGSFSFASRFWNDGSPRLTAYEYQGLLRSACYRRGSMTCLSCHAMHAGDPHGQMRPDLPGDAICTQCHDGYAGSKIVQHTKHEAASAGSRCVACHMPPVVYGVMSWHPTHEIVSPDPGRAAAHDMPDACTVCHTGKSIAWAAAKAALWWPKLRESGARAAPEERVAAPEIARALFAGDVVYRTLAAERLGEVSPDRELAGRAVPLLAEALSDPYPNVRRTARNALMRLTGRGDLPFALDPPERRSAARWELLASVPAAPPLPGWPFGRDGGLDRFRLEEWQHERKEVPVSIGE